LKLESAGDKKPDLLYFSKISAEIQLSGNLKFDPKNIWLQSDAGIESFWTVGDFNGDGKDDILATYSGVGVKVFLSDGNQFQDAGIWTPAGNGILGYWTVGDFNGDGKDDILRNESSVGIQVLLSDGSSFDNPQTWNTTTRTTNSWTVGDFNGDKYDDIFWESESKGINVLISNGISLFSSENNWCDSQIDPSFKARNKGWIVGDFNNDGKMDIAQPYRNNNITHGIGVALSTGNSFAYMTSYFEAQYPILPSILMFGALRDDYDYLIGNYLGDGKVELLLYSDKYKDILFEVSGNTLVDTEVWAF